jgi:hypothetical protein
VTYINAHVYTHHCNQIAQADKKTKLDRRLINATTCSTPTSPRSSLGSAEDVEDLQGGVTFWQLIQTEGRGGSGDVDGHGHGHVGDAGRGKISSPGRVRGGSRGGKGGGNRMGPVGIRTLPDVFSSRTGEGIFPGEHVEVVGTIGEDGDDTDGDDDYEDEGEGGSGKVTNKTSGKRNGNNNGLTFLELADNRGWVFSLNPVTLQPLFVPAVGYTYRIQHGLQFEVASTEVRKLAFSNLVWLYFF